ISSVDESGQAMTAHHGLAPDELKFASIRCRFKPHERARFQARQMHAATARMQAPPGPGKNSARTARVDRRNAIVASPVPALPPDHATSPAAGPGPGVRSTNDAPAYASWSDCAPAPAHNHPVRAQ